MSNRKLPPISSKQREENTGDEIGGTARRKKKKQAATQGESARSPRHRTPRSGESFQKTNFSCCVYLIKITPRHRFQRYFTMLNCAKSFNVHNAF